MSNQTVTDPIRALQCTKGRGVVILVGLEMEDMYKLAQDMPMLTSNTTCDISEGRRQKNEERTQLKISNRKSNYEDLRSEIWCRKIIKPKDIYDKFTPTEAVELDVLIGIQWKDIAKQYINSYNRVLVRLEKETPYLQNIQRLEQECKVKN
ncbi:hypothetical protein ECG_09197 [Echinococcus granulosus]|nr:hypothetical protein ECG_09197 [Echinococcus granulosus]